MISLQWKGTQNIEDLDRDSETSPGISERRSIPYNFQTFIFMIFDIYRYFDIVDLYPETHFSIYKSCGLPYDLYQEYPNFQTSFQLISISI